MRVGIFIVVLAAFIAIPAGAASAPLPAANCVNIDEVIGGSSTPIIEDGNFVGNNIEADWLGGELVVKNTVTKITPGGVMHFTGALNFTNTPYGDFQATSTGVVAPNGNLKITVNIADGAGFFATHGTFNLTDGTWQLRWHGRICNTSSG
jgi:hypothetical protein